MTPPLRVLSVVVNWNGRDLVGPCLQSLADQRVPEGWRHEIVLVDNDSSDDSVAYVGANFPDVVICSRGENGGFGAGANTAIRSRESDVVVLVNNDARVEPDFVQHLVEPMLDDPRLGATTATVLLEGRFAEADDGGFVAHDGTRWRRVPTDEGPHDLGVHLVNSTGNEVSVTGNGRDRGWLSPLGSDFPVEVFGFHGGACALRRSALEDVGLFDERLFMYYEDTDLSWRLRLRGWRISWAREAVSHHLHAASSGTASRLFVEWNNRNRIVVALKNAPLRLVAMTIGRSVLGTTSDVVRSLRSPAGSAARQHSAARLAGLRQASRLVPHALRCRRAIGASAIVARREVASWATPDA